MQEIQEFLNSMCNEIMIRNLEKSMKWSKTNNVFDMIVIDKAGFL